ncbi:MAG: hypothetical protein ACXWUP_07635 [Allosphingosinicella sp.]
MHDAAHYRAQAARFRVLAEDTDEATAASLLMLASDYEREASRLDPPADPEIPLEPECRPGQS